MLKVVWIEDEKQLLQECADYLSKESVEVHGASSLMEAERLIPQVRPDLLLVDWMLPGAVSGIEICKRNEKEWQLPFIMVTAKGDEFDKVLALELGADDYLTKPFGLRELSARIKAVMRRAGKPGEASLPAAEAAVIHQGPLMLDRQRFAAELGEQRLDLTRTEFLLLWKLAANPGRVFTRTHLMDEALGDGFLGYERTLDSHIRNLRRKLESGDERLELIQTVYGVGYRFTEVFK
ncbi:response regulator transcription factor [Paenibacillus sp. LHD-38]|uniref:response regulator transcription factor n=1 Tax=Paenibacillus sp. LHD-38 TaxID=3072143 RepID=UPI00280E0D3C|nr:response regulator transcription factor [Paenibacillus sp. LHD-38]MDQ8733795.1 response regulator transcription factor [Paenibacillus sp. LHD-38]